MQSALSPALPHGAVSFQDYETFGATVEETQQSSRELLAGLSLVQGHVSRLVEAHGQVLGEVGSLRAECARLGSLLEYESTARRKLDQDNGRLNVENKEFRSDNMQLRSERDAVQQDFAKLQAHQEMTAEELSIVKARLGDAERELFDRVSQYEEASLLLKRTQQELEARNRAFIAMRERLDVETTAHQLLAETSGREAAAQSRELARLNDEKGQLKNSLSQQENRLHDLQANAGTLRQEFSALAERHRRLEEAHESLQNTTALELANMNTRQEAIGSKAELAEKLLATANGRNRMTDEELRTTRTELKRLQSELATTQTRSERLTEELSRARSIAAEGETARREISAQCSELNLRLREAEALRSQRDRDADDLKRDFAARSDSDRSEIGQLRTSLDISKSEIQQLRTERAILKGQLDAARGERITAGRSGSAQPVIDISEKSLLNRTVPPNTAETVSDLLETMNVNRLPPAE